MLTIILISIGTLLVLIGATQRKKLSLWVRSEANDFIDNNIDHIKVMRQRIEDIKTKARKAADGAEKLYAEIQLQQEKIISLAKDLEDSTKLAIKQKEDGNKEGAIISLKKCELIKEQIAVMTENITASKEQLTKVENNIAEAKIKIMEYQGKIKSLDVRKKTNSLLKAAKGFSVNEDSMDESLSTTEDKIRVEELKLDYSLDKTKCEDNSKFEELYEKLK